MFRYIRYNYHLVYQISSIFSNYLNKYVIIMIHYTFFTIKKETKKNDKNCIDSTRTNRLE